jgi:hypothetical protein
MDSPSRNPLLNNDHDDNSSDGEDEMIQTSGDIRVRNVRSSSIVPVDKYKLAYIMFYFLGM